MPRHPWGGFSRITVKFNSDGTFSGVNQWKRSFFRISADLSPILLIKELKFLYVLTLGWICNPAAMNIRIFNPKELIFRITNAHTQCGRIANPPELKAISFSQQVGFSSLATDNSR